MGTLQIGAENAPSDNTSVTSANGGGIAPGTVSGGIFSSAAAMNGNYGYRFDTQASPTIVYGLQASVIAQAAAAGNTCRTRCYFRISALPASTSTLVRIMRNSGTAAIADLQIQSNGTLVLRDGVQAAPFVGGMAIVPGVWYRLELNIAPANATTATSKVMLWCGPAATEGSASNSATQSYFYSTTWNAGTTAAGIGIYQFGKMHPAPATASTMAALIDFDDFALDNGTFTNVPSTWWGKSLTVLTVGIVLAAKGQLAVNNPTAIPVKYSVIPYAALARLNLDTELSHSAILPMSASAGMVLPPVLGKESTLLLNGGAGTMLLGVDPVLHPFVLPVSALGSLVLNRGPNSIPSVLAAQILARLTLSGYRATTATWVSGASASALYGPSVDVQGMLGMMGAGQLITAISELYTDTLRMQSLARMELPGTLFNLGTFAPAGVGALLIDSFLSKTGGIVFNSPPRLVVNGLKQQSQIWKADALARLIVAGRANQSRVLSLSAIGQMLVIGRVLHDELIYDDVIARVLEWRHRADLFSGEMLSAVISATVHSALFLHTDTQALLLPSGNDAVILE